MPSASIKLFCSGNSPRLKYIAGILLGDILGLQWELVTDKRKFGKHPIINYSEQNIPGSFRIIPHTLLFKEGVSKNDIQVTEWKGMPVFFRLQSESDFPFDIFAASFYLVSRYEEYLEFKPDIYGRFPASASLAFKNGFLDKPVVDLWTRELAKSFLKKFPTLAFRSNVYSALLTIDTDQPFAYLGKNLLGSLGGLLVEQTSNKVNLSGRYRIISKTERDPYDVFDYIVDNIDTNKVEARFFFPVGDHSKFDKNPSWKNEEYRNLIRRISAKFMTGLHPSFMAGNDGSLVNSESIRLQSILGRKITFSRFHYLLLHMPHSFNCVANAEITEDFSMGYPDEPGFRAGIARSYTFYDISAEKPVDLRIVPFQVMDETLFGYKKMEASAAMELILKLINQTRIAGGQFVSIWHNTSLLGNNEGTERRKVFEFMLKSQKP